MKNGAENYIDEKDLHGSYGDFYVSWANTIVDKIFADFESRLCKNCKWYQDEVCVNGDSPLCAEFVSEDFGCVLFDEKNEK